MLLREYRDREIMSTAVALLLFVNTMVASVAPSLIAYWDNGTADSVRWGVFFAIALSYLLSALFFGLLSQNESLPMPQGEEEKSGKPLFRKEQSQPPIYTVMTPKTNVNTNMKMNIKTNIKTKTTSATPASLPPQGPQSPSRRQLHEV